MAIAKDQLYLVHISVHGLIRGHELELGRDADTGGQTKYVVELVRALGKKQQVGRVDLLTRQVVDPKVSDDYAQPEEKLGDCAYIRRITAGPRRYLRKESLWKYLDVFTDQALLHFRELNRLPDLIHAHYADAGYVGRTLAALLGCPFVFTGHSLGRIKKQRLIENGLDEKLIEDRYQISRRIEGEELSLDAAAMIVTSTRQEVAEQYEAYEQYVPERMRVIPPGIDLERFKAPDEIDDPADMPVFKAIRKFLRDPDKPCVLALARADERKNLVRLVHAFGEHPELREKANLLIIAGNRDRIADLSSGARKVVTELLLAVDEHDLYGSVAYPKHHAADDVPAIYRYAARLGGVFVNAALTEPFGLTLLEAAASGLPIVATRDGGPIDIIGNCHNGELVDPHDTDRIAKLIHSVICEEEHWRELSKNGIEGVRAYYSWDSHVETYLSEVAEILPRYRGAPHMDPKAKDSALLPLVDRMLFTGLKHTLQGSDEDRRAFAEILGEHSASMGFGVATGLDIKTSLALLDAYELPRPHVLVTRLGGEIHYGERLLKDEVWHRHLNFQWKPKKIREVMAAEFGLVPSDIPSLQPEYKITYRIRSGQNIKTAVVQRVLREHHLRAIVTASGGEWLDILPIRSSKANAVRYLFLKWGLKQSRVLLTAISEADATALQGSTLGVVVAEHDPVLDQLRDYPRIYFSEKPGIAGVLEGVRYYGFDTGELRNLLVKDVPEDAA